MKLISASAGVSTPFEKSLALFIGIAVGIISVFAMSIEKKWGGGLLAVSLCVLLMLYVNNPKRFFLFAFVFFLPINADFHFFRFGHIGGGASGLRITICDAMLLFLYMLWIIEKSAKVNTEENRINMNWKILLPILFFFGFSCLSLINALFPAHTFFELFRMFVGVMIFFYMANHVKDRRNIKLVVGALVLGLIIQCLIAFAQKLTGGGLNLLVLGEREVMVYHAIGRSILGRVGGTLGHPNTFAHYLEFLIPVILALVFSKTGKRFRMFFFIVFLMGLAAMVLTFSRGGWLSISLAIAYMLYVLIRKRKVKNLVPMIVAIVMVATMMMIFALPVISHRLTQDDYGTAFSRITLMEVAFEIIRTHPLIGVGLNNYVDVMRDYDTTEEKVTFVYPAPVHNIYLLLASEVGILGLLAFIWFVLSLLRLGAYGMTSPDDLQFFLSLGLTTGFLAFLIHGMVNMMYIGSEIGPWFYSGIMTGICGSQLLRSPAKGD